MKRKDTFIAIVAILVTVFSLSEGGAESLPDNWGLGLRLGPAFFLNATTVATAEEDALKGGTGLLINSIVTYRLKDFLALGFDLEWEQHKIQGLGLTWGRTSSITMMPRAEFHPGTGLPFAPYLLVGGGYNFNLFLKDGEVTSVFGTGHEVHLDSSVALMAGLGADMFFLSDNLALNLEIKLKYNRALLKLQSGTNSVGIFDLKGHSLSILVGFRYYLPMESDW